ncbi:MAG: heavy-metal-associated domain-containing protein [Phycisphaerae bacterium]
MSEHVAQDQLVIIRVEGMHCHQCEKAITRALSAHPGVREVEVDFNSAQASVLFDRGSVSVKQLMADINEAGYRAVGFTQAGTGEG